MGMNARLVEHAARTPQGSVFESFSSRQNGIPIFVENLIGGASAVSVNSFSRFQPGGRVVEPIDNWGRNHLVREQWGQFFTDYVNGRVRVAESLPPYSKSPGPVSRQTGSPNYRPLGMDYGRTQPYRTLPGEPGTPIGTRRRHPAYSSYTDDTEEEAKIHDGDCGSVHPYTTHSDWASSEEEGRTCKVDRTSQGKIPANGDQGIGAQSRLSTPQMGDSQTRLIVDVLD